MMIASSSAYDRTVMPAACRERSRRAHTDRRGSPFDYTDSEGSLINFAHCGDFGLIAAANSPSVGETCMQACQMLTHFVFAQNTAGPRGKAVDDRLGVPGWRPSEPTILSCRSRSNGFRPSARPAALLNA